MTKKNNSSQSKIRPDHAHRIPSMGIVLPSISCPAGNTRIHRQVPWPCAKYAPHFSLSGCISAPAKLPGTCRRCTFVTGLPSGHLIFSPPQQIDPSSRFHPRLQLTRSVPTPRSVATTAVDQYHAHFKPHRPRRAPLSAHQPFMLPTSAHCQPQINRSSLAPLQDQSLGLHSPLQHSPIIHFARLARNTRPVPLSFLPPAPNSSSSVPHGSPVRPCAIRLSVRPFAPHSTAIDKAVRRSLSFLSYQLHHAPLGTITSHPATTHKSTDPALLPFKTSRSAYAPLCSTLRQPTATLPLTGFRCLSAFTDYFYSPPIPTANHRPAKPASLPLKTDRPLYAPLCSTLSGNSRPPPAAFRGPSPRTSLLPFAFPPSSHVPSARPCTTFPHPARLSTAPTRSVTAPPIIYNIDFP